MTTGSTPEKKYVIYPKPYKIQAKVLFGYPWGTSYGTGYHMGVPRGAIFKYEGVHILYKLVANKGPLGGPYRWDITHGAKYTRIVEI